MSKPGAERLDQMLSRNHELAEQIDAADFPLAEFEALQQWQRDRMAHSFSDLIDQEKYRPAVTFFLSEIYGGLDFRERDQDMGKVMPVMVRFLPDAALEALAEAFELQAISLEFDMAMAVYMAGQGIFELDMARYCHVYRAGCGCCGGLRMRPVSAHYRNFWSPASSLSARWMMPGSSSTSFTSVNGRR